MIMFAVPHMLLVDEMPYLDHMALTGYRIVDQLFNPNYEIKQKKTENQSDFTEITIWKSKYR